MNFAFLAVVALLGKTSATTERSPVEQIVNLLKTLKGADVFLSCCLQQLGFGVPPGVFFRMWFLHKICVVA